jgi:hypothetical protein
MNRLERRQSVRDMPHTQAASLAFWGGWSALFSPQVLGYCEMRSGQLGRAAGLAV